MNKTIKTLTMAALAAFTFGFAPSTQADTIAKIIETGVTYDTVQEAINDAEDGQTVQMLADSEENVSIKSKAIALDLAGKVLDSAANRKSVITISSGAGLTLVDSAPTATHTDEYELLPPGGVITGAKYLAPALSGGGVNNSGTFTMLGGTIIGNEAGGGTAKIPGYGGGVYNNGTMTIGGTASIRGNLRAGAVDNLYLPLGKTVSVGTGDAAPKAGMAIGISVEATIASGESLAVTGANAADYHTHFSSDNPAYYVINGENNAVTLNNTPAARNATTGTDYATVQAAVDAANDADTIQLLRDASGNVTVTGKAITLDLNGKELSAYSGNVITLGDDNNAGTLTLIDGTAVAPETIGAGRITAAQGGSGARGVKVTKGTFNLTSGRISGCYVIGEDVGGGVYSEGAVIMTGGAIENCRANSGGGVRSWSSFTMFGGVIRGCSASVGGGIVASETTLNLGGTAVITNNSASSEGGGVYYFPSLTLSGSVIITDNKNSTSGSADNLFARKRLLEQPGCYPFAVADGFDGTIGVTTEVKPTKEEPVTFATNVVDAAVAERFFSDDAQYAVSHTDGNELQLVVPDPEPIEDCITFSSEGAFSLKTYNTSKNWNGTLWTSTDKTTWTEWNGASVDAAQTGGEGPFFLYVRGNDVNKVITGNGENYYWVLTGSNIACSGNIETLRGATGDEPSTTTMEMYCYANMFKGCSALTSASTVLLPATTLVEGCYAGMFGGCTSLTEAPAVLPATTLAQSCYNCMFQNCTSLTEAPALSATTLADRCCSYMFYGCTALTATPTLTATTLAPYCYQGMFYDCTALTAAPELSATALADRCYDGMFYGCKGIKLYAVGTGDTWSIPSGATGPENWGFNMFKSTGGTLQGQPVPGTTYYYNPPEPIEDCITFSGEGAFSLKTYNTSKNWNGTLWTSTDKTTWTEWNGASVDAAQTGGEGPFFLYVRGNDVNKVITGNGENYYWVLTGSNIACSGNLETLRGATGDEPSTTTMEMYCYANMFKGCTALTSASTVLLPATGLMEGCYAGMFDGCTSLTEAPAVLPATTLALSCYNCMFQNCTSLTEAPELSATTLADRCCAYMFYGCKALTATPTLSAKNLAEYCYQGMFYDCTALTAAPELPATTLAPSCYDGMFFGCKGIKLYEVGTGGTWSIPSGVTEAANWGFNMFKSTGGTLQGQPVPGTTYYYTPPCNDCLTFSSAGAFTVAMAVVGNPPSVKVEYSTDKLHWTMWDLTEQEQQAMLSGSEYVFYVRGTGNTHFADNEQHYRAFILTPAGENTIACSGNIETMLDWETVSKGEHPEMGYNTYQCLFRACTALTSCPSFPSHTYYRCYANMFEGCTALTRLPEISVTNLAEACCDKMFNACSGIILQTTDRGLGSWQVTLTGSGEAVEGWNADMLFGTGGTFTDNPAYNTTYYYGVPKHSISATVTEGSGTVDVPETAEEGATVTIALTPESEYKLGSISAISEGTVVPLTPVAGKEGREYTFTMPTANVEISVAFVSSLHYINSTVTPEDTGSVDVPSEAAEGTNVTVIPDPYWGYKFGSISATSSGEEVPLTEVKKGQEYSFTMPTNDVDISVTFVSSLHSIANTVTPEGSGTVNVFETAAEGDDVGFTLSPAEGWAFKSIDAYKTGDPATKVTLTPVTAGEEYTFKMPAYDVMIAAAFGNAPVEYVAPVYKTAGDPKSGIQEWQNLSVSDYTVVTSATSAVTWGTAGTTSWYVLKYSEEPYRIDGGVTCAGHVNLILVNGASLTITNVAVNKAGIATDPSGSFTIYGQTDSYGVLTVTGGQYGAGIGGGNLAAGSNITINGGIVTATGGENAEGNSGAGIGGGASGIGSNIVVNGGTVSATGGQYSAGIGGGQETGGSDITINGGTVTAVGGGRSAGIGGGYGNTGSGITINDGTVTAVGDCGAAAIGGGLVSVGSDISIANATLYLASPALNYEDELVSADVIGSGFASEESSSGVTIDASAKVFFNLTGVQNLDGEWLEPMAPMPESFEGMTIMTPDTQVATNRVLVGGVAEWKAATEFFLQNESGATGTITVNGTEGTVFANRLLKLPHDTTAQTLTLTAEAIQYNIYTEVTSGEGTITTDPAERAPAGTNVTVTVSPATASGYVFESIVIYDNDGNELPYDTLEEGKRFSFEMPNSEASVYVTFQYGPTDPVATVQIGGGEAVVYADIYAAWNAACAGTQDNPAVLTLLKDVTTTETLVMNSDPSMGGVEIVMTLDLNGCALQQTEAGERVIHNNGGTLTIQDSQYGKEEGLPRYFEQDESGIWRMVAYYTEYSVKGGVITGGHISDPSDGGAIFNEGGTLTILSGNIAGNSNIGSDGSYDGGAIINYQGHFRMENGEVCYNVATDTGAGIVVDVGTTDAQIRGGKIHDNTAQSGGGVSVNAGGELTVSDGAFYNNTATGLGGGAIGNKGTLTVQGGEIYNNTAQDASGEGGLGGGIGNIGTLTVTGGEIHDNTGDKGSGIGTYYMGETQPGIMTMTGGEVTKNTGVGVIHAGASLTLGGTAVIKDNMDGLTPRNLVLPTGSSGQQLLKVSTEVKFEEGAAIGVTTDDLPEEGSPIQISTACDGDYAAYFTSDSDVCRVEYNAEDTCLYLAKLPTYDINYAEVEHGSMTSDPAYGAYAGVRVKLIDVPESGWHLGSVTVVTDDGDEIAVTNNFFTMPEANVTVTATFVEGADYVASVTIRNGAGVEETTSYTTIGEAWAAAKAGTQDNPATLTLLKDIDLTGTLGITEKEPGIVMTLDLNGRVLRQTESDARVLDIETGDITIADSHFGEDVYAQYFDPSESGIWTLVNKVTDYPVKGGVITGGNIGEKYDGAAILCGGNLTLVAGNIAGNYNSAMDFSIDGGGVRICDEGTFTMTGGEICYNFATISGGGLVIGATNGVASTISGGKIHHNSAMMGGGISIDEDSRLTITGDADICDNTAYYLDIEQVDLSGVGGGVAVIQGGYLAVSGGEIHHNTALGVGGGGIGNQSVVEISGGEIYENTAGFTEEEDVGGLGGGVASAYRLTISGGEIRDNVASYGGGGVANLGMDSSVTATVTMTGGTITGNVCEDGGGIYSLAAPTEGEGGEPIFCPAELILTGGEVTDNSGPAVMHMGTGMTVGGTAVITGVMETESPSLCLGVDMMTGEGLVTAVSTTPPLAEGASIGVYTTVEPTQGYPVKFATNVTDGVATNYFHSDMGYEVIYVEEEQALYLSVAAVPVATVSIGGGVPVEYYDIYTAWTAACEGSAAQEANATLTLLTNVTTKSTLYMGADPSGGGTVIMTLDLNGRVLQQTEAGERVIYNDGGSLTVTDGHFGKDGYEHYFTQSAMGGWELTDEVTDYVVKGGVITGGNPADEYGGGAIANGSGTLTISGGNIAGNSATMGAGIGNAGTMTMTGGAICYNTATGTMGGGIGNTGALTMTGGTVTNNSGEGVRNMGTSLTLGGTVVITGMPEYGAPGLYLPSGTDYLVTISSETPFVKGASIGVTTESDPGESGSDVPITTNGAAGDTAYFTSDMGLFVIFKDGALYLSAQAPTLVQVTTLSREGTELWGVYTNGIEVVADPQKGFWVISNATVDVEFRAQAEHGCFFKNGTGYSSYATNTVTASENPTEVKGPAPVQGTRCGGEGVTVYGFLDDGKMTLLGSGATGSGSKSNPFVKDDITSVRIADGVTEIGPYFFKFCTRLNGVTGGKDLTKVGNQAFFGCFSLETITLDCTAVPKGLEEGGAGFIPQQALTPKGEVYWIPAISVKGHTLMLYGKEKLDDDWEKIGPAKGAIIYNQGEYHFFQTKLEKDAE